MDQEPADKTDAAALGAAVVAVAMTVFGDPSEYDLLTLIVSVALLLLVLGYVWRSRRDRLESLAFAAVVAIIIIPILGWAVEGVPGPWRKPSWPAGESSVSDPATVVAWIALAVLLFAGDRWRQRGGH
ncbi:MAG: hypothetical protein QOI38_681 [Sphingomonadales bacterium]|jgi:O-antigen/teichoic acid export membrane protein|nr:hypothetical protein [Sphingomonadales bacterium]